MVSNLSRVPLPSTARHLLRGDTYSGAHCFPSHKVLSWPQDLPAPPAGCIPGEKGLCWGPWASLSFAPSNPAPIHLQEVVTESLVALEGRPAGVKAGPEHVHPVRVREEIVLFHRPAAEEQLSQRHNPRNMPTTPPRPASSPVPLNTS